LSAARDLAGEDRGKRETRESLAKGRERSFCFSRLFAFFGVFRVHAFPASAEALAAEAEARLLPVRR